MTKKKIEMFSKNNRGIVKNSGITLVALVVTIVVLLILAGITMNLIMTDGGILKRAEYAKEEVEKAEFIDKLNRANLDADAQRIINKGQLKASEYFDILKNNGIISSTKVGEGEKIEQLASNDSNVEKYEITSTDGWVFQVAINTTTGKVEILDVQKADKLKPTVTIKSLNGFTISVELGRTKGNEKLSYYYKSNEEGASTEYTEYKKDVTDKTVTYEGLDATKSYLFKVVVTNENGSSEAVTGNLKRGTITGGEVTWNQSTGKAEVTFGVAEGVTGTLTYEITDESGTRTVTENELKSLSNGTIVIARLTSGTTVVEKTVEIKDDVAPTGTIGSFTDSAGATITPDATTKQVKVTAGEAFKVTVTLADNKGATEGTTNNNQSGINLKASKYVFKTNSTPSTNLSDYTTAKNFADNSTAVSGGTRQISVDSLEEGTYYLHVLIVDNAGNSKEVVSEGVVAESSGPTPVDISDSSITTIGGYADKADEKGNVKVKDASGNVFILPKGFRVMTSEGTSVKDGIVISDSDEDNGNEFVWVPVPDITQMAVLQSGSATNYRGVLYDFGTSSSPNDPPKNRPYSTNSYYKEPAIVDNNGSGTSYDEDATNINDVLEDKYKDTTGTKKIQEQFKTQLQAEFNNMVASVKKYGGFYIGRYETGNISSSDASNTPVVQKGNKKLGGLNWYQQYKNSKTIKGENTNVTTSMIWGCQWDQVMNWWLKDNTTKRYVTNSNGKGNYGANSQIATGSNPTYAVKNIYDMAGNVDDWTIEANSTNGRVIRGGNYNPLGSGAGTPASCRFGSDPSSSYDTHGSRSTLLVNPEP